MRSNTTISIKDLSINNFLSPKFKLLNISNTINQVAAINIDYINDKLSNNIIQSEINEIFANTLLISAQADNYYNIGIYLTNIVYDTGNLANVAVANASYIAEYSNTVNNWVFFVGPIVNSRYLLANTIYNNISNVSSNIISSLNISTNAYTISSGIYNKALLALTTANTANDLTIISLPLANTANDISSTIETTCDEALELSNNVSQLVTNVSIFTTNTSNFTFSISNTAILALNLSTNAFSISTESFVKAQTANTIANNIYNIAISASDIANTANLTAYNTFLVSQGNASLLISGTIIPSLLGLDVSGSSILYGNNSWKPLNANLTSIINLSKNGWTFRYANNVWINKNSPTFTTANLNVDIQTYSENISNSISSISEITTGTNTTFKSFSPAIIAESLLSITTVMDTPIGGKIYKFSGSFTPVLSKIHRIIVIGAGGSGSATRVSGNGYLDTTSTGMACGGGAGGCAIKDVMLSSGVTYTVTIGTGGSSQIITSTLSSISGSSGGSSSFSGNGISTIIALGGNGGQGQSGFKYSSRSGGSGGTSSNGDYNFTGGNGGNCYGITYGGKLATGGGAITITGNAYSAGNCTEGIISANYVRYYPGATGGAGIGGNSGEIETYAGTYTYCATGGGGSGGPSDSLLNPASGITSGGIASSLFRINYLYMNNPGGNSGYSVGYSAYDGGGGGGGIKNEGNCSGGNGGMFGGGGAACCGGGGTLNAYNATAGNGGIGAGGGGALSMLGTATSGSGGQGLVIILW